MAHIPYASGTGKIVKLRARRALNKGDLVTTADVEWEPGLDAQMAPPKPPPMPLEYAVASAERELSALEALVGAGARAKPTKQRLAIHFACTTREEPIPEKWIFATYSIPGSIGLRRIPREWLAKFGTQSAAINLSQIDEERRVLQTHLMVTASTDEDYLIEDRRCFEEVVGR